MDRSRGEQLEKRLLFLLSELEGQPEVASSYSPEFLAYNDELAQIKEYIEVAGEYEVAYESIVATLEVHPFKLSGLAAVKLLELGLLLGFKTERDEDRTFDRRK